MVTTETPEDFFPQPRRDPSLTNVEKLTPVPEA